MTIELVKILEAAKSSWIAFCEYYEEMENAETDEMRNIYERLMNESHASYKAFCKSYEFCTGKSVCGISQLEAELEEC